MKALVYRGGEVWDPTIIMIMVFVVFQCNVELYISSRTAEKLDCYRLLTRYVWIGRYVYRMRVPYPTPPLFVDVTLSSSNAGPSQFCKYS